MVVNSAPILPFKPGGRFERTKPAKGKASFNRKLASGSDCQVDCGSKQQTWENQPFQGHLVQNTFLLHFLLRKLNV